MPETCPDCDKMAADAMAVLENCEPETWAWPLYPIREALLEARDEADRHRGRAVELSQRVAELEAEVERLTAERDIVLRAYARIREYGGKGFKWAYRGPDGFDRIVDTEAEAYARVLADIRPRPGTGVADAGG